MKNKERQSTQTRSAKHKKLFLIAKTEAENSIAPYSLFSTTLSSFYPGAHAPPQPPKIFLVPGRIFWDSIVAHPERIRGQSPGGMGFL